MILPRYQRLTHRPLCCDWDLIGIVSFNVIVVHVALDLGGGGNIMVLRATEHREATC